MIVNTAFADQAFGRSNPLGRRIRFVPETEGEEGRWYEVVGVVGPLGANILRLDGGEAVYLPGAPGEIRPLRLAIHIGRSPEEFTPRLREIVAEVDPLATIDEPRGPRALSRFRPIDWYLTLVVQSGLAALVLVLLSLAVSSLYAIMSFAVSERTREIGVRMALGAGREWSWNRPHIPRPLRCKPGLGLIAPGDYAHVPLVSGTPAPFENKAIEIST